VFSHKLRGYVTAKKLSEPLETFTDWEWFQNLAPNLMSPRIEINSGAEADKAALEFTAFIDLQNEIAMFLVQIGC
jgi:hypothetical protein